MVRQSHADRGKKTTSDACDRQLQHCGTTAQRGGLEDDLDSISTKTSDFSSRSDSAFVGSVADVDCSMLDTDVEWSHFLEHGVWSTLLTSASDASSYDPGPLASTPPNLDSSAACSAAYNTPLPSNERPLPPTRVGSISELSRRHTSSFQAVSHGKRWLDEALLNTSIVELAPPDHLKSAFDRYLFEHYWSTLTMSLYPIAMEGNPFREVYAALSQSFPPLTDAILCASSSHLTALGRLPHGAVEPYRKSTRTSFRYSLAESEHETGLAATVLFTVSSGVSNSKDD